MCVTPFAFGFKSSALRLALEALVGASSKELKGDGDFSADFSTFSADMTHVNDARNSVKAIFSVFCFCKQPHIFSSSFRCRRVNTSLVAYICVF